MPIPKPKPGEESQGDYIDRCMEAIGGEYDDPEQAVAVCGDTWRKASKRPHAKAGAELVAEVFAVGRWNGMEFNREDLQSIAAAFHALGDNHQVPLKMGHNEDQPFTDGQPALGWVADVWVEGDKLLARFSDVPDVVYEAMKTKLYRNVSVELDLGVEYKGGYYPLVLSGVALLGADIPAVNTLKDLQAYMGRDFPQSKRVAFTAIDVNKQPLRSEDMSAEDKETISSLKATVEAQKKQIAVLTEEKVALQTEIDEHKAEFKVLRAAEETRKLNESRAKLSKRLDEMVKGGKITPASRDEFMRDFDDAESKETVIFAVDKLEDTIDKNPAYYGAEQARRAAEAERAEAGKDPSEIVAERTHDFMLKNGVKDMAAARTAVLRADPELAARYTKGGES